MGQQQLLLIILGVIVVGIAVAVGITLFSDNSVSSDRDAMGTDMLHLAAKARHYYGRPTSMGGGGHSFSGLTMARMVTSNFSNNANGRYEIISVASDSVVFLGTGKVVYPNGDSLYLQLAVYPNGPGPLTKLDSHP